MRGSNETGPCHPDTDGLFGELFCHTCFPSGANKSLTPIRTWMRQEAHLFHPLEVIEDRCCGGRARPGYPCVDHIEERGQCANSARRFDLDMLADVGAHEA